MKRKWKEFLMRRPGPWGCFFAVSAVLWFYWIAEYRVVMWRGCFEELSDFGWRGIAFLLAASAPVLLLPERARKIWCGVLLWLMVPSMLLQFYLAARFEMKMDATLVSVAAVSPAGEIREFAGEFFTPSLIGNTLLLLLPVLLVTLFCARSRGGASRAAKRTGALLLLPFLGYCAFFLVRWEPMEMLNCATLTRFGKAGIEYASFHRRFIDAVNRPELPGELVRIPELPENTIGIIVIGESASRDQHSLYGYGRDTNPELSKLGEELLVFRDVLSPTVRTASSLANVFTFADLQHLNRPRCSFDVLLRAAGYRTALASNQWQWGAFDTPTSVLFKDAGFKCYLQYRKYRAFDDELIEQFPEEWWDGSQPTVLYIHLIGSHMPFSQRHPADFAPFSGREDRYTAGMKPELAELLNEYDNSIAFTDRVVAACIERLRALKRPAFLLYFSDHGEAVAPGMEQFAVRNNRMAACYKIPFVLWLSPEYRAARPEFAADAAGQTGAPHQTDRLIWSLADLAGIRWNAFPEDESLFSKHYRPRPRFLQEGAAPWPEEENPVRP